VLYQDALQENRDDILILTTDGLNNYGYNPLDVARILKGSTKIFVLTPNQTKDEVYISSIGGEKKIPLNTEYDSWVKISKLGGTAKYTLDLLIDGRNVRREEIVQSEATKRIEFTFSFVKPGVHVLEVKITPLTPDYFAQNNRVSKVIKVVERPRVLLISSQDNSPLIKVLEKNYQLHLSPTLGENFQSYTLVILDDQSQGG